MSGASAKHRGAAVPRRGRDRCRTNEATPCPPRAPAQAGAPGQAAQRLMEPATPGSCLRRSTVETFAKVPPSPGSSRQAFRHDASAPMPGFGLRREREGVSQRARCDPWARWPGDGAGEAGSRVGPGVTVWVSLPSRSGVRRPRCRDVAADRPPGDDRAGAVIRARKLTKLTPRRRWSTGPESDEWGRRPGGRRRC